MVWCLVARGTVVTMALRRWIGSRDGNGPCGPASVVIRSPRWQPADGTGVETRTRMRWGSVTGSLSVRRGSPVMDDPCVGDHGDAGTVGTQGHAFRHPWVPEGHCTHVDGAGGSGDPCSCSSHCSVAAPPGTRATNWTHAIGRPPRPGRSRTASEYTTGASVAGSHDVHQRAGTL